MIGIYKIENLINHRVYIGQSITIKNRLNHHRQMLNKNIHFCDHLQKSWNKYGENNFSFEILEECSKNELDSREEYWLNYYGGFESEQTYNQRGAGQETHNVPEKTREKLRQANLGKKASKETIAKRVEKLKGHPYWGRKWTEEEKKRASEKRKGKINDVLKNMDRNDPFYRQRLSNALKGKKKSKEHSKHISEGRKGIVFSEEHKRNISLGKKGTSTCLKGGKKFEKDGIIKWARPEEIEKFKQEGWQEYHTFNCGDYVRSEPWNKGKPLSEEAKKHLSEMWKGAVWMNNGTKNKQVKKDELESYLAQGWQKGRMKK